MAFKYLIFNEEVLASAACERLAERSGIPTPGGTTTHYALPQPNAAADAWAVPVLAETPDGYWADLDYTEVTETLPDGWQNT